MLEEVTEMAFPGGAFVAAGVAVGATFGEQLRPVAKEVLKRGMKLAAQVQEAAAEAYEQGQDLIAEARHEYEQENGTRAKSAASASDTAATPPRGRRSAAAKPVEG
ncbi:MAG: DUF5132 domain-containing protein [Candidatus Dormibacteraeota bacterium]|nr:DUF5132 domain-containing protein [Candidatus Dormibacteraeota bacterium]